MEPTVAQLRTLYRMLVGMSNMLRSINLVRMDERTKRLVMLVGETIEIEILSNGEALIK
ncbi:unknown protein [Calothrix sp. PCC 7716]|nr:unknown protein [Calothrix sp. PCC 7716]